MRGLCTGTCSSPVGSQEDGGLPPGGSSQVKRWPGARPGVEQQEKEGGYCTVLDQAEVSPDSKPSSKMSPPEPMV